MTEPDVQELQEALGELAQGVMELAEAVKEGPFSDAGTRRVAVSVSTTARKVALRFGAQAPTVAERDRGEQSDPATAPGAVAVPEDVVALARAGKTLEAVTRYRAVSNASLDEAKAVIRDIT